MLICCTVVLNFAVMVTTAASYDLASFLTTSLKNRHGSPFKMSGRYSSCCSLESFIAVDPASYSSTSSVQDSAMAPPYLQ